ncbi:MAG: hypothetical protein COX19_14645 [Desulfobacterales bacterium CG23_combo_of_CG06-09_8_20_14_all_51_8]|nr:MAG: hypothetical protein COX19_14645 [Desulfobacterales bacterium CG23_combo_of_CG06-09_8_20_14_all_51_8]
MFSKLILILSAGLLFFVTLSAQAAVQNLGIFGRTYPIAERDAIQEIKDRAAAVDWNQVFSPEKTGKAIKEYKPETISLPTVLENRKRLVDISYSLEMDIPDGKGGILYPMGYRFNPLAYVNFPKTLVVINGNDARQVEWFAGSSHAGKMDTLLLITDGSYYDLIQQFNRPVFYATTRIVQRLQLQAVPSVARQSGKYMEVNEIALSKNQ